MPFDCVKISPVNKKFAEALSHRDYLGAIMNLGIERSMIGDILIKEDGAYVFVLKRMTPYLTENLTTIRHTTVQAELCEELKEPLSPEFEEISGTVSSLRLDSIVALCGRLSRTKAAQYIEGEKVFLNGQLMLSPSRTVKEGEILSIRGIGKFLFSQAGGQTKKGRTSVTFLRYK